MSSTCFEHPSVHLQEDLYMQLYGIFSCIHISSLVEVRMLKWMHKNNYKAACTILPEDKHLDVRNVSKAL